VRKTFCRFCALAIGEAHTIMLIHAKKTLTHLFSVSTIVFLLSGCQKNYDSFLDESKQAIKAQEYSTAVIALKNAVQLNPESAEARLLLADTYFTMGAYLSATKEYEKAAELGATCDETAEHYIISQFRQFRLDDALNIEALNCEVSSLSKTGLLYQYLSAVQLNLQNIAYRVQAKAVEQYPKSTETALIQIYELIAKQEYADADSALKTLEKTSTVPEISFAKAWLLSFSTDYQGVIDLLDEYQSLEPNDLRASILKARMYLLTSNYKLVEETASKVLNYFPNHRESNELMSMALFREKRYAQAITYAEKAIDLGSRNPQVRIVAGLSEFASQNLERAYQHLSNVENKLAENVQLSQLYAYLQYRLGYDANLHSNNGNDNNLTLAQQYAASLFNNADSDNVAKLEEAGEDGSGLSTLLLAGNYIELQNYDVAEELIAEYNVKYPNTTHGYNLKALLEAKKGNADAAMAAAAQSLEISPSDIFAGLLTASEYIGESKFNEALAIVEKVLSVHTTDTKVLDLFLRLHSELNTFEKGMSAVKATAAANPANDEIQKLYIRWLLRANALNDAVKFSQAVLEKGEASDKDFYWQSIFDIYLQQKNMLAANTVATQWAEALPDSTLPLLRKANLLYALKQPQQAMNALNEGIQRFPGEHTFKVLKARLLVGAQQYELARNTILSIPEQFRDFYQIRLMQSQILANLGQPEKALELLNAQYKETPNNEVATLIFGHFMKQNKSSTAVEFLKQHNERFSEAVSTQILLANSLMQTSPEQSISMFETIIDNGTSTPQVLNNLSWLYFEKQDYEKALEHANAAIELAPNNIQVLDTLANIYLARGNKEQALQYINKGLEIAPNAAGLKSLYNTITTE